MDEKRFIELQLGANKTNPAKPSWFWNIGLFVFTLCAYLSMTTESMIAFTFGFLTSLLLLVFEEGGRITARRGYWQAKLDELGEG